MKPVYNYNLEQCNRLFKKGVHPIGVGVNDKTGNVFHVFKGERYYFDMLSAVLYEIEQEVKEVQNEVQKNGENNQCVNSCK